MTSEIVRFQRPSTLERIGLIAMGYGILIGNETIADVGSYFTAGFGATMLGLYAKRKDEE